MAGLEKKVRTCLWFQAGGPVDAMNHKEEAR